jgi:ribonuclease HI
MKQRQLNFKIDGASSGNPGPSGYGVVVYDARWKKIDELKGFIGKKTNNVAEYSALLAALRYAESKGAERVKILSDSELLVKQLKGLYKIRSKNLMPLVRQAFILIKKFPHFSISRIPREKNKSADYLARKAIEE